MGLFDRFRRKVPSAPAVPANVDARGGSDVLCAPVSGRAVRMADVPDPVFSGEVLGRGCAIWPDDGIVYSPVTGEVTVTMGHAVGLMSDDGVEALVHIGVDTVNLQGRGFTAYVRQGDRVVAGQPVLKIDRAVIAEAGYKDCVMLVVSNTSEFASVDMVAKVDAPIAAGDVAVRVVRA